MHDQIDVALLQQWQGRQETWFDEVTAFPLRALKASLEAPYAGSGEPGDELPPLWHWLYFLPLHARSMLGEDGHARKGEFLPPVPLPRRMWAGGRFEFLSALRVGDRIKRVSTIVSVKFSQGRSGRLVFVTVRHEIFVGDVMRVWEEHDIVYRDAPRPDAPQVEPVAAAAGVWRRQALPDEVLLFRYSALTFNGHRIHYDRRYATQLEHYPGLVVHGPLVATLLLDLLQRELPGRGLKTFSFRAVRPSFDGAPLFLNGELQANGQGARLWASDADGWLTMEATAGLA